jgi:hypothetical protein
VITLVKDHYFGVISSKYLTLKIMFFAFFGKNGSRTFNLENVARRS